MRPKRLFITNRLIALAFLLLFLAQKTFDTRVVGEEIPEWNASTFGTLTYATFAVLLRLCKNWHNRESEREKKEKVKGLRLT